MAKKVDIYSGQRLRVLCLTEWENKRTGDRGTRFTDVGIAYVNKDGSVNLYLDMLPARGQTLQIRTADDSERGAPQPRKKGPDGAEHEDRDGRPF